MNTKRNETFVVLSALGILFIILGHLDFPLLNMGGLFPYYSFHVMLFVFISGYFYKPEEESNILNYIKRKFLHLLVPYFIWNLIYGILATLLHKTGMQIGESICLYNLFVSPFYSGHQFMYQAASWFVPALFLIELCNIIGRKILAFLRIRNEYAIMILYFIMGITAVFLAKRGSVYDFYKLPARIMLMAPCFQMGHLYKEKLESKDTLPSYLYFPLLLIIQLILVITNYGQLAFSAVWVTGFAHSVFLPYLTTITGIAFWLRVARELTPLLKKSRFVTYLGTHTFSVMMHHLMGFFLLNCTFSALSGKFPRFSNFDTALFRTDIYYVFLPDGMSEWKWLYLFMGLLFPLSISFITEKCRAHLGSRK